jgi:hypothetical protein
MPRSARGAGRTLRGGCRLVTLIAALAALPALAGCTATTVGNGYPACVLPSGATVGTEALAALTSRLLGPLGHPDVSSTLIDPAGSTRYGACFDAVSQASVDAVVALVNDSGYLVDAAAGEVSSTSTVFRAGTPVMQPQFIRVSVVGGLVIDTRSASAISTRRGTGRLQIDWQD